MSRTAIVTGAASGIGAALARALVARGDTVVVADLDHAAATAVAAGLDRTGPGRARAASVDVRDADAVHALVDDAVRTDGRLDLLFNNAGIPVGGPVEDLSVAHWDRALDVNVRGVVHGVAAAYPVMLEQGHGHIVNTASLAGLIPVAFALPYSTTKHAVVGLSLSLRVEAAAHGVRVSALCPGVVDTPILDRGNPEDLPGTRAVDVREYLLRVAGTAYPADALARDALRGVDRDRGLIVAPWQARLAWRAYRVAPRLVERRSRRQAAWARDRYGLAARGAQQPRPLSPGSRHG